MIFHEYFLLFHLKKKLEEGDAHKECIQILHCLCGEIEVNCSDGYEEKVLLNKVDMGVYIPANGHIKITYLTSLFLMYIAI